MRARQSDYGKFLKDGILARVDAEDQPVYPRRARRYRLEVSTAVVLNGTGRVQRDSARRGTPSGSREIAFNNLLGQLENIRDSEQQ